MPKTQSGGPASQSWQVFVFHLSLGGRKREVQVLAPDEKAARCGLGAFDDEQVRLQSTPEIDRKFRKLFIPDHTSQRELARVFRAIYRYVRVGAPVPDALQAASRVSRNPRMKGVLGHIYILITRDGEAPHEAFGRHTDVFGEAAVASMAAGDESGRLPQVLDDLARQAEKDNRVANKAKGALFYPGFLMMASLVSAYLVLYTSLPQTVANFEALGFEVPWILALLHDSSQWVLTHWYLSGGTLLGVAGIAATQIPKFFRTRAWDWMRIRLPIMGRFNRMLVLTRSLKTLSILLASGANIVESYEYVTKVARQFEFARYFRSVRKHVMAGREAHEAFMRERSQVTGMEVIDLANQMSVAQHAGRPEEVIRDLANGFEEDLDILAENLPRLIEPLLLAGILVIIGVMIALVLFPQMWLVVMQLKEMGAQTVQN